MRGQLREVSLYFSIQQYDKSSEITRFDGNGDCALKKILIQQLRYLIPLQFLYIWIPQEWTVKQTTQQQMHSTKQAAQKLCLHLKWQPISITKPPLTWTDIKKTDRKCQSGISTASVYSQSWLKQMWVSCVQWQEHIKSPCEVIIKIVVKWHTAHSGEWIQSTGR
jgi:hypothetical protein